MSFIHASNEGMIAAEIRIREGGVQSHKGTHKFNNIHEKYIKTPKYFEYIIHHSKYCLVT